MNTAQMLWRGIGLLLGASVVATPVAAVVIASLRQVDQRSPQAPVAMGRDPRASSILGPIYVGSLSEGLERPLGVAVSEQDEVYVADGACRCIRIFDPTGKLRATLGPQVGDTELQYPIALTFDAEDTLYVSDLGAGQIAVFHSGVYKGRLSRGQIPTEVQHPAGIQIRGEHIYINDLSKHQVLLFDSEGNLVRTFGAGGDSESGGGGHLSYPNYALTLSDGSLLVADSDNNRLQMFDNSGKTAASWTGPLLVPRGLAPDAEGNIHVANVMSGRIEVFSRAGKHLGGYAQFSGGPEFGFPTGLAAHRDKLYVADRGNKQVQIGRWPPRR